MPTTVPTQNAVGNSSLGLTAAFIAILAAEYSAINAANQMTQDQRILKKNYLFVAVAKPTDLCCEK
jgi:hypothetical protein